MDSDIRVPGADPGIGYPLICRIIVQICISPELFYGIRATVISGGSSLNLTAIRFRSSQKHILVQTVIPAKHDCSYSHFRCMWKTVPASKFLSRIILPNAFLSYWATSSSKLWIRRNAPSFSALETSDIVVNQEMIAEHDGMFGIKKLFWRIIFCDPHLCGCRPYHS